MSPAELRILESLDALLRQEDVRACIAPFVSQAERMLIHEAPSLMAWKPIPLSIYCGAVPPEIQSSWVFVLRAGATTGAERHPNSHQRVMSCRASGNLQVWANDTWQSHELVSEAREPLTRRWASIPPNVWHQAVVPDEHWTVVSFHTATADELIEERPVSDDRLRTRQRRYVDW